MDGLSVRASASVSNWSEVPDFAFCGQIHASARGGRCEPVCLCHAVRVQKENVNTRRSREKRRKKGGTRGAKKRSLQESLTSREPRREKQKADPVAKRKAPDEDGGSSRSGVTSVEDLK